MGSAKPSPGRPPAIVLVDPQLGENIGMVARAMLNCGFGDLRLVRPRDGWPSEKAARAAAGADAVLEAARLFDDTESALADLRLVYAATARPRGMLKEVVTPDEAVRALAAFGDDCGVVFGGEAMGLNNDDVALADAVLKIPSNAEFWSLNIAQAVLVVAYEWLRQTADAPARDFATGATRLATREELLGFFTQLESALDESGFMHIREKRPIMVRNLRNLFQRAHLTEQEVRTLRGVVKSLGEGRKKPD